MKRKYGLEYPNTASSNRNLKDTYGKPPAANQMAIANFVSVTAESETDLVYMLYLNDFDCLFLSITETT